MSIHMLSLLWCLLPKFVIESKQRILLIAWFLMVAVLGSTTITSWFFWLFGWWLRILFRWLNRTTKSIAHSSIFLRSTWHVIIIFILNILRFSFILTLHSKCYKCLARFTRCLIWSSCTRRLSCETTHVWWVCWNRTWMIVGANVWNTWHWLLCISLSITSLFDAIKTFHHALRRRITISFSEVHLIRLFEFTVCLLISISILIF